MKLNEAESGLSPSLLDEDEVRSLATDFLAEGDTVTMFQRHFLTMRKICKHMIQRSVNIVCTEGRLPTRRCPHRISVVMIQVV